MSNASALLADFEALVDQPQEAQNWSPGTPHLPAAISQQAVSQRNSQSEAVAALQREQALQREIIESGILSPPAEYAPEQQKIWNDTIKLRPLTSWSADDRLLLDAYVRAWLDIQDIQRTLDVEGFVVAGRTNPLLVSLSARIRHMRQMRCSLGLDEAAPVNEATRTAMQRGREKMDAANSALNAAGSDSLLAQP